MITPVKALMCAAAVLAACVVVGCSDSKEAKQGADAAELIRTESPAMARHAAAIAACREDISCLREAGASADPDLSAMIARVESQRDVIGGECATRTIDAFVAYGRSLRAVAVAAREGSVDNLPSAFLAATRRSNEFTDVSKSCGFTTNRPSGATMGELQPINLRIAEAGQEFQACTDFACMSEIATRIESAASDGIRIVDEQPLSELPACEQELFETVRSAYVAYREGAQLLQEGDERAEGLFAEGVEHERAFAEAMPACIGVSG